jgi:hypothetical protein
MSDKTKFHFCELFLAVSFLVLNKKKLRHLGGTAVTMRKSSLGRDMPSVGKLVGMLLALTLRAASALLELSSSTLSS